MTLPEPAWRVKSRPCPFYQQGFCFFADSCNFLHTAPPQGQRGAPTPPETQGYGAHRTPRPAPLISVESPNSTCSSHSPRIADLLLALKDVLDDPQEQAAGDHTDPANAPRFAASTISDRDSVPSSESACSPQPSPRTITHNGHTGTILSDEHSLGYYSANDNTDTSSLQQPDTILDNTLRIDPSLQYEQPSIHTTSSSPVAEDDEEAQYAYFPHASHDDLLSPVEISSLNQSDFSRRSTDITTNNRDDTQRPPSTHSRSSPQSPCPTSTFDLLASPFGSPGVRVLSPRLSAFMGRRSIVSDSGINKCDDPDSDLDSPRSYRLSEVVKCSEPSSSVPDVAVDELDSSAPSKDPRSSHEGTETIATDGQCLEMNEVHGNGGFEEDLIKDDMQAQADQTESHEAGKEDTSFSPAPQPPADSHETVTSNGNRQSIQQEAQPNSSISHQTDSHFPPSHQTYCCENEETVRLSIVHDVEQTGSAQSVPNSPGGNPVEPFSPAKDVPPGGRLSDLSLSRSPPMHEPASAADEAKKSPKVESPKVGKDCDGSDNSQLPSLDPANGNQLEDVGPFVSLYEGYSERSSSPLQEPSFIEIRPVDPMLGESSSISTPLSSAPEGVFTSPSPERQIQMMGTPIDLGSPNPSRRSFSSRRSNRLSSPFALRSEDRNMGQDVDDGNSPTSTNGSRKIPFGWRRSSASSRSSKSIRTSSTARAISRQAMDSPRSPPPADDPPSLISSPMSPVPSVASRLRPLRLSVILNSQSQASHSAVSSVNTTHTQHPFRHHRVSISNSSVSSNRRTSHNPLLSSNYSAMSDRMRNSLKSSENRTPSPLTIENLPQLLNFGTPQSAPLPHSQIWRRSSVSFAASGEHSRASSQLSEPAIRPIYEEDDDDHDTHEVYDQYPEYDSNNSDTYNQTYQRITSSPSLPTPPPSAPSSQPPSRPTYHAVSAPEPTLMFAIASDDVAEVRRVLETGDAGPNDIVGPQTALEFALTNNQLANKMDIVKTLLAYGADPRTVKQVNGVQRRASVMTKDLISGNVPDDVQEPPSDNAVASLMDEIDPALKYYVERADAPHTRRTSALIHRSFFRPLARVRYELIGQDCVLEQLFRVLSMQSRGLSVAPTVVLLCGPSGHGKSLLARKFGSLLDVPTHTVNMTTLRSTHDLWQSHSMSPYETPTTCTLAEFLINNEGKRCVVVLDEIEKTDEKTLWSLLMPWELGRCSFEAGNRHIDVRNVVWLGTSNIGHDLVFKHQESRAKPDDIMSREEYVELMKLLRPLVAERLGASVLSRVTTVLPFVPFTLEEKKAICSEALYSLGGEDARSLSVQTIEDVIRDALENYCPIEGARSLHRAISNQLIEII